MQLNASHLSIIPLSLLSVALYSCDGEGDNTEYEPDATQWSIDTPIEGDILNITPTSEANIGQRFFELEGPVTALGEATYTYAKTDDFTFSFTFNRDNIDTIDGVVTDILLSGSLGTELRQLLLDTEQDGDGEFEQPNLGRITELFQDFGTGVRLSPDGTQIYYPMEEVSNHLVTSTQSQLLVGNLSGKYTLSSEGVTIGFKRAEPTDSRFFADPTNTAAEFWVPVLTSDGYFEPVAEEGAWAMSLVNFEEEN